MLLIIILLDFEYRTFNSIFIVWYQYIFFFYQVKDLTASCTALDDYNTGKTNKMTPERLQEVKLDKKPKMNSQLDHTHH